MSEILTALDVLREGAWVSVPLGDLRKGDRFRVDMGLGRGPQEYTAKSEVRWIPNGHSIPPGLMVPMVDVDCFEEAAAP